MNNTVKQKRHPHTFEKDKKHIPQGLEASIRLNVWQAIMACQLMLFVSGKSLR